MNLYGEDGIEQINHDLPVPHEFATNAAKHRAIIFMAFICVGKQTFSINKKKNAFL